MAEKALLTCLEKRELLNESVVSVDKLLEWGRRYEDAGLIYDAVDFYEKTGAREDLTRLLDEAKLEGNVFLVNRVCKILKAELTSEEWFAVGEQAERAGKMQFAAEGFRRSGRDLAAKSPHQ
jgi:hypothetical protein